MKDMKNMISMNLRCLRTKHGFSQEEMAEKLGVSRQTVAKWENGESLPDINKCIELAFMFKISLDAFATCSVDESVEIKESPAEGRYLFGMVKVGDRGQVVIPKSAREVYDIKPGDKLLAVGDKRGMALAKINQISEFDLEDKLCMP